MKGLRRIGTVVGLDMYWQDEGAVEGRYRGGARYVLTRFIWWRGDIWYEISVGFMGQIRRLSVKPVLSHVVSVENLDAVVGEVDGGGDGPDGVEAAHDDNPDEKGNGDSHVEGRSGDGAEVEEGLAA